MRGFDYLDLRQTVRRSVSIICGNSFYKWCHRKRECVSELVYRMCEENAVEKLMTFNFAGFSDEVEDALAFKARNVDPRVRPFYSRILYTWYVLRGDYRNGKFIFTTLDASNRGFLFTAALTMYQRARKLHDFIGEPSQ